LDRSRKFSVEIGNDEKNEWDGRELGVGRLCECRVIRDVSIAMAKGLYSAMQNGQKSGKGTYLADLCPSAISQKAAVPHAPVGSLNYRNF